MGVDSIGEFLTGSKVLMAHTVYMQRGAVHYGVCPIVMKLLNLYGPFPPWHVFNSWECVTFVEIGHVPIYAQSKCRWGFRGDFLFRTPQWFGIFTLYRIVYIPAPYMNVLGEVQNATYMPPYMDVWRVTTTFWILGTAPPIVYGGFTQNGDLSRIPLLS